MSLAASARCLENLTRILLVSPIVVWAVSKTLSIAGPLIAANAAPTRPSSASALNDALWSTYACHCVEKVSSAWRSAAVVDAARAPPTICLIHSRLAAACLAQ